MTANQSVIQLFVGLVFNKIFNVRTILIFKSSRVSKNARFCRGEDVEDEDQALLKTQPGEVNHFFFFWC